jgi:hypothetical protein
MASLDVVDCLTHVTISNKQKCFEGLLSYLDTFILDHSFQVEFHFIFLEFVEAKNDASALDGLDDL